MDKDSINKSLKQQQEQFQAQVLRRFAHHGQPVSQVIRQALLQKNGLYLMLQRLGLLPPATLEFQIQALANYLKENGAANFLRVLGARSAAKEAPAPSPGPVPEEPIKTKNRAPAAGLEPAAPMFDEKGRYLGPERRSGVERRSGIDRRGDAALINKNQRYGGDRRKTVRRKCDRMLANRLGLDARTFPPPPEKSGR